MVHAWNAKEYGTGSLPWTGLGSQVKSLRSSLATHPLNALLRCLWTVVISSLLKHFGNEGSNTRCEAAHHGSGNPESTEVFTGNKSSIWREVLWQCASEPPTRMGGRVTADSECVLLPVLNVRQIIATQCSGNAISLVGKPFPNENLSIDLLTKIVYTALFYFALFFFNQQSTLQCPLSEKVDSR